MEGVREGGRGGGKEGGKRDIRIEVLFNQAYPFQYYCESEYTHM